MNSEFWLSLFDEAHPVPGATPGEIDILIQDATRPLSVVELIIIQEYHRDTVERWIESASKPVDVEEHLRYRMNSEIPVSDDERETIRLMLEKDRESRMAYKPSLTPEAWTLPNGPLPPAYLDFLRWSNGGIFRTGERRFEPLFEANAVRKYMLNYSVPEYMPEALPFAFDGGGTFYLFDMRRPMKDGEYPIVVAHAGNLGYGATTYKVMGSSFLEVCRSRIDPME